MRKGVCTYNKSVARRKWRRHLISIKRRNKIYVPQFKYNTNPNVYSEEERFKLLECPVVYSTEKNLEGVITYINKVRKVVKRYKALTVDLSKVEEIDMLAIVVLLSHIEYVAQRGVYVNGNYPINKEAYRKFVDSGFLALVQTLNDKKPGTREENSLIVDLGRQYYKSDAVAQVNEKALKLIKADSNIQLYQRLNGIVGEMGGNVIQYAYSDIKHYMYGYSYAEEENCIRFFFADAGYGIVQTLKRSFGQKFFDNLHIKGDVNVLNGAFRQKYGSKTGDNNRHLGLPYILETQNIGMISNLKVISNYAYIDFNDQTKSHKLSSHYAGTLYVWEINGK